MSTSEWDERYAAVDALWSGRPNPTLVEEVTGLPAGRALEVGAGEGADAVWLAQAGWQVTAVDLSAVALARAARAAEQRGVAGQVTTQVADVLSWRPTEQYDLVVAHFLHFPTDLRVVAYRVLRDAVAPGGRLLIVAHDPADVHSGLRHPHGDDLLVGAPELAAALLDEGWQVETAQSRPRPVTDADGVAATAHDAVLRARRLPDPA